MIRVRFEINKRNGIALTSPHHLECHRAPRSQQKGTSLSRNSQTSLRGDALLLWRQFHDRLNFVGLLSLSFSCARSFNEGSDFIFSFCVVVVVVAVAVVLRGK
jgi:hypothetical protein